LRQEEGFAMNMKWDKNSARGLLIDILQLEDEVCEWSDMLVPYIDEELAGRDPAGQYPEMHEHLQSCPLCSEEHAELLDLRRRAKEGRLPQPDRYYPIDLSSVGYGVLDLESGEVFKPSERLNTLTRQLSFWKDMLKGFIQEQFPEEFSLFDMIHDQLRELRIELLPKTLTPASLQAQRLGFGFAGEELQTPGVLLVTLLVWRDIITPLITETITEVPSPVRESREILTRKFRDHVYQYKVKERVRDVALQAGLGDYAERLSEHLTGLLIEESWFLDEFLARTEEGNETR
jgi:hypothetical protein